MSTELAVPTDFSGLPVVQNDTMLDIIAPPMDYLPRVELFTAATKMCKSGKSPMNYFGIVKGKDKIDLVGETLLVFPLALRFRSFDFSVKGKVTCAYDPHNEVFKAHMAQADAPRPKGEMSNFSYGPEFLVYVKDHGYATVFYKNKSWKSLAKTTEALMKNRCFAKYSSYYKEQGTNNWQAPDIMKVEGAFELPPIADMVKAIEKFRSVSGVQTTDGDLEGDVEVQVVAGAENDRPR